jgi:hypothetical protein
MIFACYFDYRVICLRINMERDGEVSAEDRQLDERYRPALAERRIRFYRSQVVPQLQDLCVKKVVRNLDYYCSRHDSFSDLRKFALALH